MYGDSRKEVSEKMHKKLISVTENKFIDKSKLSINNLLEIMFDEESKANAIAESTLLRKKGTGNIISKMYIADMPIQKVNVYMVNECLLNLAHYSNSYISKICMLLGAVFNKAVLLQILDVNIFSLKGAVIKPRSHKKDAKIDALTVEEQQLFIQQLAKKDYKYKDIFYLLIHTGARVGEILSLRREDINFKEGLIYIRRTLTKSKKDTVTLGDTTKTFTGLRDVPMTAVVKDILKENMNFDFLFLMDNKFVAPSTINNHFKRICKDAGIRPIIYEVHRKGKIINLKSSDVNTHMLRHSFATRWVEAKKDIKTLQEILGHKDIRSYYEYIC